MIHQYKNNGFHICLDVNSGCVHVVDELVYELLPFMEEILKRDGIKASTQEVSVEQRNAITLECLKQTQRKSGEISETQVREAVDEILELTMAEMLFAEDIYEDYIESFKNRETVVKALCLHIAHDCNLACRYCFAAEGEYHG